MRFFGVRVPRRCVAYAYSKKTNGSTKPRSNAYKFALLTLPVITFGLGTWQVLRLREKQEMIARLELRTSADVVELPSALRFDDDELVALSKEMEYRRVHLRGQFVAGTDLFLGPRTSTDGQVGFHLINALRRESDGAVVLVNRGWMPTTMRDSPQRSLNYFPRGIVDVIGFVRLSDRPSPFVPANNVAANRWFSVDIAQMAAAVGNNALPILIDVKEIQPVADLPVPSQTRVTLRNDHAQYIATWYTLTGFLVIFARGLFRK